MNNEIDSVTIKRAQKGDAQAFERIIDAYGNRIYHLAFRMCGNEQDALDVGQETAVRIWRYLKDFRGDANLTTWIHRIAHNACIDFLRKKREETINIDVLAEKGFQPSASEKDAPERVVERKETLTRIGRALLLLPEEQRAAVILRDINGLTYEEIASVQNENLNTIKSRISRGRKHLASLIEDEKLFIEKSV